MQSAIRSRFNKKEAKEFLLKNIHIRGCWEKRGYSASILTDLKLKAINNDERFNALTKAESSLHGTSATVLYPKNLKCNFEDGTSL